ncbi:MAG TPA: hypothetical protein EYH44_02300 [Thermoprotei archaeon]|nr:hypothetical protein [Thermoprotei archaeon]
MNRNEKIVIPGEGIGNIHYKGREEGFIYKIKRGVSVSTHLGVANISNKRIDIIPYKYIYVPKIGDYVIGFIVGYAPNGWIVEIGSYVKGFLPANDVIKNEKFDPKKVDLDKYLKLGDLVGAIIQDVNKFSNILLTINSSKENINTKHLGKLTNYFIIKVHTTKLPRIIGKKGSMIKIIKKKIDGDIIIAQNGVILYKGSYENFKLLKSILQIIIKYTYASGLTGKIAEMLGIKLNETYENGINDKGVEKDE